VTSRGSSSAVLFDLDGTLLDLEVDIVGARAGLAQLFGPLGFEQEFRPVLLRIREAAHQVAGNDAQRDELMARGRAIVDAAEADGAHRARARPGAADTLRELTGRGLPLGIVTDNGRRCVGGALAAAGLGAPNDFTVIVTRDEVQIAKPDPEGVLAAALALLPEGGTLWFIGDSPRDAAAGRRSRAQQTNIEVRIAGVQGGRGSADELEAAGAEIVLESVADVPAWVQ